MQSLFSVFRRPAPPTTFAERRRSSATAASVPSVAYNDTQPRHLGQPVSTSSAPPKPVAKVAVPPPPRSRQVSPKQSVEIRSAEVRNVAREGQSVPLYVAVYANEQAQQSQGMWRMALHLAAAHDAEHVVKYSCRSMVGEDPDIWTSSTEAVKIASEKDLVARVLIGHVLKTGDSSTAIPYDENHIAAQIGRMFITLPLPDTSALPSDAKTPIVIRTWLVAAINALRTAGLLVETPSSPTKANAGSRKTKSTDATTTTTTAPTRPDLISRPTDNWNDLPADFLSPDAPAGGSHRRKMRNSTPRITPKSSSGQLGEVGAASKPSVTAVDGSAKPDTEAVQELKSAEAILDSAEEWAEKCQQQWLAGKEEVSSCEQERAGRRLRTLDVRSELELDA